ncbi:hypothetical protein NLJ89_g902 [Agrocybe chaxingu]|uniref:Uncharacterized protein n=1 Tax=Agrocybe chaxingu TaxID=84603 RepID=A0A9W8TG03_9AGAR|nr:hypothetical protein NLJ89_g902 [Agrocybe chaxingu]
MTLSRKSSSSDGDVAERARQRKSRKLSRIFGDFGFLDYPGYAFSSPTQAPRTAPPFSDIEEVGQVAASTEGLVRQSRSEESTMVEDTNSTKPRDLPFSDKSNLKTLGGLGCNGIQTTGWKSRERRVFSERQSEVRRTKKMSRIFGEVPPVGMVKRISSSPMRSTSGHSPVTQKIDSSALNPKASLDSALSEESLPSDTMSDPGHHSTLIDEYEHIEVRGGFSMDMRSEGSNFHDRRRRAAKLAHFFGESKLDWSPPESVYKAGPFT